MDLARAGLGFKFIFLFLRFKVLFRRFLRFFSDFLWFFKVFFSGFLSRRPNETTKKQQQKSHGFFCQSEIHRARYNLSFNPRYTLLGII